MANWSGTYTNNTPSGTSTGGNTSTTFNDGGASWPTSGAGLANFTVKITGGTGAGQERLISSNSATLIGVATPWTTTPDATSTYEIIARLRNGDHIVATVQFQSGIIAEVEDNATVYIDGNYIIRFELSCLVRMVKTESTYATFEPNNRVAQGKAGFWGYLDFNPNLTNTPSAAWLKISDGSHNVLLRPSSGLGDGSTVHHLWLENPSIQAFYTTGAALTVNMRVKRVFLRGSYSAHIVTNTSASTFDLVWERMWFERISTDAPTFGSSSAPDLQRLREMVFKDAWGASAITALASGKQLDVIDSYVSSVGSGNSILRCNTGSLANTFRLIGSVLATGNEILNAVTTLTTYVSAWNDFVNVFDRTFGTNHQALRATSGPTSLTSDNDYIQGRNEASIQNIDVSEDTDSTNSPSQYQGLTSARTNAKASRNRPFGVSNVAHDVVSDEEATVTFDCESGAPAATTVDSDSASGQKVLNIAATTNLVVGEPIEIGFDTARFEIGHIASISVGVSVTLEENLSFTHTAAQADTVRKRLRHIGLPFIKYGTTSDVYGSETPLPPYNIWGLLYIGFFTSYQGRPFSWKHSGHSVTLEKLSAVTTYYYKACYVTPFGEVIESTEGNFTTPEASDNTDPGEENVREGTEYLFQGETKTGTLDLPVIGDVRDSILYDNETKEGVLNLPAEADVRAGVSFDNDIQTGSLDLPSIANVKEGVAYDNASKVGTLKSTDPGEGNVLNGVPYFINSVDKTGTLETDFTNLIAEIRGIAISSKDLVGVIDVETTDLVGALEPDLVLVGILKTE